MDNCRLFSINASTIDPVYYGLQFTMIEDNMVKVSRFRLSVCATAFLLSVANSAQAHLITPFICTPEGAPDGVSRFVNSGGMIVNQFATVKNGNSTSGLTLTDIDSNSMLGATTFEFDVQGTTNLANGPWVYAFGTDQNNNPIMAVAPMSSAKKVRSIPGGFTGTLGKAQFGIAKGTKVKVTEFVVQDFPSSTASNTTIFGMRVNGLTLDPVMSTKKTCPAGDIHP